MHNSQALFRLKSSLKFYSIALGVLNLMESNPLCSYKMLLLCVSELMEHWKSFILGMNHTSFHNK